MQCFPLAASGSLSLLAYRASLASGATGPAGVLPQSKLSLWAWAGSAGSVAAALGWVEEVLLPPPPCAHRVGPNPDWAKPSISHALAAIGAAGRALTRSGSKWQAAAAASTLLPQAKADSTSTVMVVVVVVVIVVP
jgi:hypothetical protein